MWTDVDVVAAVAGSTYVVLPLWKSVLFGQCFPYNCLTARRSLEGRAYGPTPYANKAMTLKEADMTRRHGLVWCVGLLLGFTLAVGYAAPGYDTPGLGTAQPALPSKDTEQREIIPLPTAGATEHFRYARERGGLYRITPSDGTPSYLVSEHFLRVTLANTDLDGFGVHPVVL